MAIVAPFDVALATEADLADYYRLSVAAFAVDRPDAPPPTFSAAVARLRAPITRVVEQRFWAARQDGQMVGVAIAQVPEMDNAHLSITDIRVHPQFRRRGIGTALLRAVLPELHRMGQQRLIGEGVTAGGDGEGWAQALGFAEVNRFVLQALQVAGTDRRRWEVAVPPGYGLVRWVGVAPEEIISSYARARWAMADAPAGDSTYQVPQWTAATVRAAEAVFAQRGVERRVVVAVHTASGAVAGVTEVEIYPAQPEHVVQQDTVVLAAHRGRGLGHCLKAAMMRWLLAERPNVERVVTNTAADNSYMIRVNHQIGYVTTRTMIDVEADISALAARLGD